MKAYAALFIVGVLVVACGDGGAADAPPMPADTPSQRLASWLYPQATEFQQEILADGAVTFDEYERATLAAADCFTGAGIEFTGPELQPDGFTLNFAFSTEGFSERAMDSCSEEWVGAVSRVWTEQHVPSESERPQVTRQFAECLEAAGVDLGPLGPDPDRFALSQALDEALREAGSRNDGAAFEGLTDCKDRYWTLFTDPVDVEELGR